jgi:hypothetical protein
MFSTLHIAEKTTGSRGSLALLRWALVVISLVRLHEIHEL